MRVIFGVVLVASLAVLYTQASNIADINEFLQTKYDDTKSIDQLRDLIKVRVVSLTQFFILLIHNSAANFQELERQISPDSDYSEVQRQFE
jgi:hypothetical protein